MLDLDDGRVAPGHHVVHFYEGRAQLAHTVSGFLGAGLVAGETALVVATAAHRAMFDAALTAAGIDVAAAQGSGQYLAVDARELVASFVVAGAPDPELFERTVGALVASLTHGGRPVRIYGEMVALLWDDGHVSAAIAVEELWNELQRRTAFTLFCAYSAASLSTAPEAHSAIQHRHTHVVPDPRLPDARPGEVSRRFEPTPTAVRAARHFVRQTLLDWDRAPLIESAELIVSELAANAVRHGASRFAVTVSTRGPAVRIAVRDLSTILPTLRALDAGSTGGRGMPIISAMSCGWGAELHRGAKTVWAEIQDGPR